MKAAAPKPTVVVDTREQTPLAITDLPMIHGTLATGDCRATRKGRPFVSRREIESNTNAATGQRESHELSIRRS